MAAKGALRSPRPKARTLVVLEGNVLCEEVQTLVFFLYSALLWVVKGFSRKDIGLGCTGFCRLGIRIRS